MWEALDDETSDDGRCRRVTSRAGVPGGWLVRVTVYQSANWDPGWHGPGHTSQTMAFVADPGHRWAPLAASRNTPEVEEE